MQCRIGCGACCIAPSISSLHKPAGERCVHLNADNLCKIFGQAKRPQVCSDFKAAKWLCGDTQQQALDNLIHLEQQTA
ncbi:YkgJ family cysteine cluster protein [Agarivorans sp. Toyoura001]|uniref:YkgJ family cysteine cluster protein n=1 Tax=unclassified Agarivorans TaxID=2636026 RepID=UPI0010ECDC1A|nr:YkgJ family cysteine cluster protein [Agarivorans sp. Toyoura001]GDY26299.1 zinc/iron-chelating domain-containing protein [Agarivorans sp. Toyoura001]